MSNNLAICDDCGKEVSIHAKTCPNCGCVFEDSISVLHKVLAIVFSALYAAACFFAQCI